MQMIDRFRPIFKAADHLFKYSNLSATPSQQPHPPAHPTQQQYNQRRYTTYIDCSLPISLPRSPHEKGKNAKHKEMYHKLLKKSWFDTGIKAVEGGLKICGTARGLYEASSAETFFGPSDTNYFFSGPNVFFLGPHAFLVYRRISW